MTRHYGTVWCPISIRLESDRPVGDPYTSVELTASFEHESGETYEVPGFWAGERDWEVRFSPPLPGSWE
jgi:hypothetical protein